MIFALCCLTSQPSNSTYIMPLFSNPSFDYSLIFPMLHSKLLEEVHCLLISVVISNSFHSALYTEVLYTVSCKKPLNSLIKCSLPSQGSHSPTPRSHVHAVRLLPPSSLLRINMAATLDLCTDIFCWALGAGSHHLLLEVNSRSAKPLPNLWESTLGALRPPEHHFLENMIKGG